MHPSAHSFNIAPMQNNWLCQPEGELLLTLVAEWMDENSTWVPVVCTQHKPAKQFGVLSHVLLQTHLSKQTLHCYLSGLQDDPIAWDTPFSLKENADLAVNYPIIVETARRLFEWLGHVLPTVDTKTPVLPVTQEVLKGLSSYFWTGQVLDEAAMFYDTCPGHTRIKALEALKARDFASAVKYLQQVIQKTPPAFYWPRAKDATRAGLLALLAGQPAIGEQWLKLAITWSPSLAVPYLQLGLIKEEQSDIQEALNYCRQYQSYCPNDSRVAYALTRILGQLNQWHEAIAQHHKLIDLGETDAWQYCDLANAYLHVNEPDNALPWFKKILEDSPADHPARDIAALITEQLSASLEA